MINRKKFFDGYRSSLDADKKLTQDEVNHISTFLDMVDSQFSKLSIPQWSYVFATVFHETNATFMPVKEAYWLSEEWRKNNLRYFPFYGRGFVQITWKENYDKFSKILNQDLVNNPDKAMLPLNAFNILVYGFINGSFTAKKISDYINTQTKDYKGARRCINGTDKAQLIAGYATLFEKILN